MKKIAGIDEAGRGPVIGPLVMVGFQVDEDKIDELRELGVKDSKQLTKEQREDMYAELIHLGKYSIKYIPPRMLDLFNINSLEKKIVEQIIKDLKPHIAIIDGFERDLDKKIRVEDVKIIAEHKADEKYEVVSAASIIAKVERDREIEKIKEEIGIDFGSGYPSDEKTRKFLEYLYKKEGKFPDFVRRSWDTSRQIENVLKQRKITDFFDL